MKHVEIVAHRGVHDNCPENTLAAFRRAIELGADAVELDVRLTSDRVPVVFHYFYLDANTSATGTIFNYTYAQLQDVRVFCETRHASDNFMISTLDEVLESIGSKIGLEIEVKGPEPESAQIVAGILRHWKHLWPTIEITGYEPMLLSAIRQHCPGLPTDLLFPRSEPWMHQDVVTYSAIHRARMAGARAVHLHPTQLSPEVIADIRQHGIEIHAWEVNDESTWRLMAELDVPRICTDNLQLVHDLRERML
jgi:glycerophosphoryl diester phosphodiesterase